MYLRGVFVAGFVILLGVLYQTVLRNPSESLPRVNKVNYADRYPLYDPEMAPQEIKDQVLKGYKIMLETKEHLPDYAGDMISCTNCHFSAGNSFGGRSNGFSLVGVDHKYPKILESGEEYTLEERINSCFLRSLNGKPLPVNSPDMQSLIAYLEWISSGIPKGSSYPWMGVKEIRSKHTPDPENGAEIYAVRCAECHGKNGQGHIRKYDRSYPPLWGENSFNDSAGMNKLHTFAYFIYENMPYNDPKLTVEEALDVASFVIRQERPKFIPPK